MKKISTKIGLAVLVGMIIILLGNIAVLYKSNKESVVSSVSNNSLELAKNISKNVNADDYEAFLQQPEETETYWQLRKSLNDIRKITGAMYVYTVGIKDKNKVVILVDGMPKGSKLASSINEITDSTSASNIKKVLNGKAISTSIVHDEKYGDYLSSYVPIKKDHKIIGVLGVDTNANAVNKITSKVGSKILPISIASSTALIILFLSLLFYFLNKKLKPLQTISHAAEDMANGNLFEANEKVNGIKTQGKDEIQQVLTSFKRMTANTINMVEEIKESSKELLAVTKEIESKMLDINHSNKVIVHGIQKVEGATDTQLKLSDESVKSVEEMAKGIQRIAESASEVSEQSYASTYQVKEGYEEIQSIIKEIQSVKESVNYSAENMEDLEVKAKEIESIVDLISGIAEQTNLLALNAAIEAARAGEGGKGFAVVSQEVRKLAEQSKSSTQRISEVLNNFKVVLAQAITHMKKGANDVESGTMAITGAGEKFYSILVSVEAVCEEIQEISAVTQEMSAGSEEIAASLDEFALLSKETSEITKGVATSTSQQDGAMEDISLSTSTLQKLSNRLEHSVDQFKI